jgi:hypothetical protein
VRPARADDAIALLLPTLRRVTPDGKLRPLDPTDLGDLEWLEERLAAKGERKRAARFVRR